METILLSGKQVRGANEGFGGAKNSDWKLNPDRSSSF